MKTSAVLIFTALAATSALHAADQQKIAPYELRKRSSFNVDPSTRTPFWPIGWKREATAVVTTAAPRANAPAVRAFQIQPGHFTVTSILLAHPPLATINGRAFGEGEILPVMAGDTPVRVIVKAIRDGGVWLDQSGHQIFVPMKRQEIQTKPVMDASQPAKESFTIRIPGQ
jgi:hypothetical protein